MRLDRGNAGTCAQLPLGPLGTGGHARPGHDALGSERDAGEGAAIHLQTACLSAIQKKSEGGGRIGRIIEKEH